MRVQHTYTRSAVQTSRSEGGLFLHLHLLLPGACRHVVVDAFIMIVHGHRQNLLSMILTHNILIKISIDLQENKSRDITYKGGNHQLTLGVKPFPSVKKINEIKQQLPMDASTYIVLWNIRAPKMRMFFFLSRSTNLFSFAKRKHRPSNEIWALHHVPGAAAVAQKAESGGAVSSVMSQSTFTF